MANRNIVTKKIAGHTCQIHGVSHAIRAKVGFEFSRWYDTHSTEDFAIFMSAFPDVAQYFLELGIANAPKTEADAQGVSICNFNGHAVRKYGNGYSVSDLASMFGVSESEIIVIVAEAGK